MEKRGVGAAGVGVRVIGRLTPELISRSPQYMSCVNQYELDLRGCRIAAIENLGATENQFDSIDLSDNAIVRLDGFPKLPRLSALHLNNNRVAKVARGLEASLPRLEWLILTNNKLAALADLEPLGSLPRLKYVSLIDNPVTKQPGYRLFMINRCKRLKVLDFKKVKDAEREEAEKAFGGKAAPEPMAAAPAAGGATGGDADEQSIRKGPTPEQVMAIKAAIAAASTLDEVRRLEEALTTGQVPSEVLGGGGGEAAAGGENGGAGAMEEG